MVLDDGYPVGLVRHAAERTNDVWLWNCTLVGTAIDVRHLAATPVGHNVRAEAEVIKVEGKRIEFKVSASDEIEEIGNGTHQRTVINLRSFNERLAIKGEH